MSLTEVMKIKKISISHIINILVLLIAGLVALKIYQGQDKKITQIITWQDEQKKKNEILLGVDGLKKRIELYKQAFRPKDNREIINMITQLAKVSKVRIISLRPVASKMPVVGRREKGPIYGKDYFNLSIETDGYHQLGKFVRELENNPMTFIIESLAIKIAGRAGGGEITRPDKISVMLAISKFFFKD